MSGSSPGRSDSGSIGAPSSASGTPAAEVGGGGREDVAAGERRAGGGELVVGVRELDGARWRRRTSRRPRPAGRCRARPGALAVADLDRDRPALGADAGVDDREHHARAQVLRGAARVRPPAAHVVGRDVVGEVDRPSTCGAIDRITDFTTPTNSSPVP